GGAKPIQKDNGPRQGPEICDRPCFHEIARRQRQVARAYYLLLLFPFASGLPRRPGSAVRIFQNRLTYEDKTKNGSAAVANRDRDTQTKTTAAGVCGSQRIPPRRRPPGRKATAQRARRIQTQRFRGPVAGRLEGDSEEDRGL